MTGRELFDLFSGDQANTAEVAIMDLAILTCRIGEARRAKPDGIPVTDGEIAEAILAYATQDVIGRRRCAGAGAAGR